MIKRKTIPSKIKVIYFIMLIIGLIILVVGAVSLIQRIEYDARGTRVRTDIIEIVEEPKHYIVIQYQTEDGTVYEKKIYNYKQDVSVGDHIGIKYMNDNPEMFTTILTSTVYYVYIFILIFGCAITGYYIFRLSKYYDKLNKIQRLIVSGEKITTRIIAIEQSRKDKYFGKFAKIIICVKDSKIYISDNIWTDDIPESYVGRHVYVYIDSKNKDNYIVDYITVL